MAVQALTDSRSCYGIPEPEATLCAVPSVTDSGFSKLSPRVPDGMDALLCDSEGVERFHQFLRSNYSSGHLLDFWFACKGFRSNVDPNDPDKLFQVAKVIYRTYIKTGAVCAVPLPSPLRHEIIGRMSSYHRGYKAFKGPLSCSTGLDRSLFDLAQESVMSILEHTYYPKFVEFVTEMRSSPHSFNGGVKNSSGPIVLSNANPLSECQPFPHTFTEKTPRPRMRWKRKCHKPVSEQQLEKDPCDHSSVSLLRSRPSSSDKHEERTGCPDKEQSRNTKLHPLLEANAVNEENSTHSNKPMPVDKDGHVRKVTGQFADVKQGQNLAETDPSAFVQLLTARLEKVKESRGKMEKLLSWVNQIDDKCYTTATGDVRDREYLHSLVAEETQVPLLPASPSPRVQRTLASSSFHTRTQSIAKRLLPDEGKTFDPLTGIVADEDAQGILDDHCSRIWSDDFEPIICEDLNEINLQGSNPNRMIQSSYVPGKSTDPISRRSFVTPCTTTVHGRRRTSLSAAASQCAQHESEGANDPYRYRSSHRRNDCRSKRSDARSTASWDSGVVDNCAVQDLSFYKPGHSESETKSLIAAASLQALSSSTTELAIVNSEVTAQLVARMTRHYQPHHRHQHNTTTCANGSSAAGSHKPPLCYKNFDPYCHPAVRPPCGVTSGRFPSAPSGGTAFCSVCFEGACHCDRNHLYPPNPSPGRIPHSDHFLSTHGHSTLPTASDTSSTFDSGISSTYDKLPLTLGQINTDRTSRTKTTFDWPTPRTRHVVDPQHPISLYNPTEQVVSELLAPNQTALPATFYSTRSHSQTEGNFRGGCVCPTCTAFGQVKQTNPICNKALPTFHAHPTTRPSGQLLQCWLQLQTSSSKHVVGDAVAESRMHKPFTQHDQQPSYHNTKHSSCGSKSLSGCVDRLAPSQTMARWSTDKSQPVELQHKVDCASDSKDTAPAVQQNGIGLIVGYYLCDDPVPYRTVWMGRWHTSSNPGAPDFDTNSNQVDEASPNVLTLGQFKQLIAKKGIYRYFFKKPSDEFGTGAVHEELTDDNAILPLWDGKVVARIERAD